MTDTANPAPTMRDKDIVGKGPKKRDPASFELRHAILVPAGTILRQEPGKPGKFSCPVAYGAFSIDEEAADAQPSTYRKVVTS